MLKEISPSFSDPSWIALEAQDQLKPELEKIGSKTRHDLTKKGRTKQNFA